MSPRLLRSWREIAAPLLPPDAPPRHSPLVVAHPGSGAAVKSWPVRAWRCVLKELGAANVVLTGTSGETGLCERIADGLDNVQSVAGRTSLPQLAALLERADVAIGTDNGPMHLAGALGTATVRLFGPSNPARYGPWPGTAGQHVLTAGWSCPRCEDLSSGRGAGCGCMTAIAPQDVIDRVREVLDDGT